MAGEDRLDELSSEDLDYTLIVDQESNILVVDDEEIVHQLFASLLENTGYSLRCVGSAEAALDELEQQAFNLLVVDKNLPGMSGIELMREVRARFTNIEVIIVTAFASYESAVEAMRLGAFDYIEKPFTDLELVREKIARALERQHLAHENEVLMEQLRSAHRELRKGSAESDAPPAAKGPLRLPTRETELRAAHALLVQNVELKRMVVSLSELLRKARQELAALAERSELPANDLMPMLDSLNKCWTLLQQQALKLKDLG